MGGYPLALQETLDGVGAHSHVKFFSNELERHAVVMALDLDVIVDIDRGHSPLGILVGFFGKRPCLGAIKQIKELAAGLLYLAQHPVV